MVYLEVCDICVIFNTQFQFQPIFARRTSFVLWRCHFYVQEDDKKLLKEVGKNGEGRPDEVQQLIDEVSIKFSWQCSLFKDICCIIAFVPNFTDQYLLTYVHLLIVGWCCHGDHWVVADVTAML